MEPLVLTFDIGTQSLRAVLVDASGNLLSKNRFTLRSRIFPKALAGQSKGRILLGRNL